MNLYGSDDNLVRWYEEHEKERIDEEYESVCAYMAARGRKGNIGDALPNAISSQCAELINSDIFAFQRRIREHAYAMAMERITA